MTFWTIARSALHDSLGIAGLTLGLTLVGGVALLLSGVRVLPTIDSGVFVLRDGTRIEASSHEEVEAVIQANRGEIRFSTLSFSDDHLRIAPRLLILAGFLAVMGWVAWRERVKLPQWLRVTPANVLLGALAGAALLAFGWLYETAISALGVPSPDVGKLLTWLFPQRWLLLVFAAVLAPVAEELFFRGRVFDALERHVGLGPTVWVTAAVFAGAHVVPTYLPAYFLYGVALAVLRVRTGGLVAPMTAHAVNNAVALWILP